MEPGESWREAAERELREETGFAAPGLVDTGVRNQFPIVAPWTTRYAPGTATNEERIFTLAMVNPLTPTLQEREHRDFAWLSPSEAWARCASATNRNAIVRQFGVTATARRAS